MKISVFLPCRKGSQRVINKNTRPFGNFKFGLLQIKLQQLLSAANIDRIYLSSDDEVILDFAKKLKNEKIVIHKRNEFLSSNSASADMLVNHALDLIQEGVILWTHVTSPFFTQKEYENAITLYKENLPKFDSLMSVTALKGFFWDKNGAINYDRSLMRWPPTQDTNILYEINSACFIAGVDIYKNGDRIGQNPYLYAIDKIKGVDIDYEEDFFMAQSLFKSNPLLIGGGGRYNLRQSVYFLSHIDTFYASLPARSVA
ncbi:acylneuraminate cytidylyltransferase [Helicobacter sp. MIT 00-7814]|uniref:acylneuraminate cytidylyltransferase family protein n=1 Tax=unclassified Helicobacter TaxID=2593540 RepID=UPI000E1F057B|nr:MULTISPECIES: acylneuraminate cytidylyltransferase family protein [unclassified Helicobacter]RDU57135.1 acylneuraminate cytidylyltransferase [Helicobacter sp. MIT 00-7814]RDU57687.1 acylneuraminate cytidylyltransferase [Helicobacter sp. MIT 99-10781]